MDVRAKALAVAWLLGAIAGCSGGGRSCERYAEVTCEKACACSPDPGCNVTWGAQVYTTATRAECETILGEVCSSEGRFDPDGCLAMVADTSCAGAWYVHPMCSLGGADSGPGFGQPVIVEVSAPERTPLASVAIRGVAFAASRVVVRNEVADDTELAPVAPGGDFCVDVPLPAGATSVFEVFAIAESGDISLPTTAEVVHEPDAAEPDDPVCEPDACDAEEDCANDLDDDCNALVDECDPACNGCADDELEPNDVPFAAMALASGSYSLALCPCREDWFRFELPEGGGVDARATFTHADVDIDLRLMRAADAEAGSDTWVASSQTTSDEESISYVSTAGGTYYLRVYSFQDGSAGGYRLDVSASL